MKKYCLICKKETEQTEHIHWDGAVEWVCEKGHLTYSEITGPKNKLFDTKIDYQIHKLIE